MNISRRLQLFLFGGFPNRSFGNILPIYLGPMVFTNAHPITCYIWWSLAMLGTCKGHCGYRIFGHADYHEEHHVLYKYNYGGMGLLDYLFGTTAPTYSFKGKRNK